MVGEIKVESGKVKELSLLSIYRSNQCYDHENTIHTCHCSTAGHFLLQLKTGKEPSLFCSQSSESPGYVVPKDSMAEPKVIPVGKPTVVRAGKPKVVLTNTNVHPAGIPKVVIAGIPKVCTPGQDSFSLPKTVPAIDSPFIAGIPEVVIAKEAYTKEQNPQNFSSFGKLQGLKGRSMPGVGSR